MYTELILGVEFKQNTPEYIINALNYVINNKTGLPELEKEVNDFIEEYDLFTLFYCTSAYFPSDPYSLFNLDKFDNTWHLTSRANLKNGGRIEKFLEFIKDYVEGGSGPSNLFAIVQYEEAEFPDLWFPTGKCKYDHKEFENYYNTQLEKFYALFSKLRKQICPDFVVTEEILSEYGLTPGEYTYHDALRVHIDEIIKRLTSTYEDNYNHAMNMNAELIHKLHNAELELMYSEKEIEELQKTIVDLQNRLNDKEIH